MKAIFVLRLAIQDPATAEMGVLAISHIVNGIGLRNVMSRLNYFFAIAVHVLIKFPTNQKIKKYIAKIFEFYIKEKKNVTISKFEEI
jgi:hypothetical protein